MTETVDSLTATKESRPQLSEVKVEDRENGKGKKEKLWRRIKKRIPFWRRKAETEPNEVVEEVAEMRDGLPEDWDDL